MPALFWRARGSNHVRRCCGQQRSLLLSPQGVIAFLTAMEEEVSVMRGNAKRRVSRACVW